MLGLVGKFIAKESIQINTGIWITVKVSYPQQVYLYRNQYLCNCSMCILIIATPQPTVPTIVTNERDFTFSDNDKNKFIQCHANSTPTPEITWEYDETVGK